MLPDNENLKKDSNQPPIVFSQTHDDDILKRDSNKPLDGVSQITENDKFKQDSKNNPFTFSQNLNKLMDREELIMKSKSEILATKEENEPRNESDSDNTKLELNFNISLSF
jgi:hypothetical protein